MGQPEESQADVITSLVGDAVVQAMTVARKNPNAPLEPMRLALEQQVRPAVLAMITSLKSNLEMGADAVLESAALFLETQEVSSGKQAADLVRKVKSTFPAAA